MIRRSVRARFHTVYWNAPTSAPSPAIYACNHHGWFDGYLMFLALTKLGVVFYDWIQEYDAFPLFGKAGGLPFPAADPQTRAATIVKTIKAMKNGRSLLLFVEGKLHPPPDLWEFGDSMGRLARKLAVPVVPVAIRYEMAIHERPVAYLCFGTPISPSDKLESDVRKALVQQLSDTYSDRYKSLFEGTKDVNERLGLQRFKR